MNTDPRHVLQNILRSKLACLYFNDTSSNYLITTAKVFEKGSSLCFRIIEFWSNEHFEVAFNTDLVILKHTSWHSRSLSSLVYPSKHVKAK